jgi:hypothetical protein
MKERVDKILARNFKHYKFSKHKKLLDIDRKHHYIGFKHH